ncbi:MAG: hypothetical protein ABIS38_01715 [Sphingomicrobium sp.]
MHKALIALTIFGAASGPALAQTAPQAPAQEAAPAKPQMVKKTVCRRVVEEETTGSRLGSAPKVCKTVEVPAGSVATGDRAPDERALESGAR